LPLFAWRFVAETQPHRSASVAFREQLRLPAASHRRFRLVVVVAAPWILGTAALSYGYVPVLLREQTHGLGVAYATLLTVLALGVSAAVQPLTKRLDSADSARGLTVALVALTFSIAGIGLVAATGSPALGVVAAALSGVGIGIAMSTGLLEVQRIAGTRHLAGLTGLSYATAYLGFLLPTTMAALTPPFTTSQLFGALVVLGIGCTAVLVINSRKHLPGAERVVLGAPCAADRAGAQLA
jgi:hypothetical protein